MGSSNKIIHLEERVDGLAKVTKVGEWVRS